MGCTISAGYASTVHKPNAVTVPQAPEEEIANKYSNPTFETEATRQHTCSNDDGVQQGGCVSRSNTVEEHWGVKDDGIDSSELLEHHEEERDG